MSVVRVIRTGLCTTVQDLGRPELREYGVPVGGALDRLSHELANRLVGNPATAATLEMTLTGDELEWPTGAMVAVTGAEMAPMISLDDAVEVVLPTNRPVTVPAGARIRFQTARRGCRGYLAVVGGIDVPLVMGSRSTYQRALIGGFHGRSLQAGDVLPIGTSAEASELSLNAGEIFASTSWFVRPLDLPPASCVALRVLPGSHLPQLSLDSQAAFWNTSFLISPQSDRMGYRLSGESLRVEMPQDLLSEGTSIGTIQLPPDGNPILLMADSAPTGGYRRIAHVISADLPIAAQLRPGQRVSFVKTTLNEAHRMVRQQRDELHRAMLMAGLT